MRDKGIILSLTQPPVKISFEYGNGDKCAFEITHTGSKKNKTTTSWQNSVEISVNIRDELGWNRTAAVCFPEKKSDSFPTGTVQNVNKHIAASSLLLALLFQVHDREAEH